MKYIKLYENYQSRQEIKSIMQEYDCQIKKGRGVNQILPDNFTINPDGTLDIDGDLLFIENWTSCARFEILPLKFSKIQGHFMCSGRGLTELTGAPKWVKGHFFIDDNNLTNLIDGPQFVGGIYNCEENPLTSLEGIAEDISSGNLYWKSPKESIPEYVLQIEAQYLTTLQYFPKRILNKPSSQYLFSHLQQTIADLDENSGCDAIKLFLTLPPDILDDIKSLFFDSKLLTSLRQNCPEIYQKVKNLQAQSNQWSTDLQADAGEYGL